MQLQGWKNRTRVFKIGMAGRLQFFALCFCFVPLFWRAIVSDRKIVVYPVQKKGDIGVRLAIQMAQFFNIQVVEAPAETFKLSDIGMQPVRKWSAKFIQGDGNDYNVVQFECKINWDGEAGGGCGASLRTTGKCPFVRSAFRDLARYIATTEEFNLQVGELTRRWFELCCAYLEGGMDGMRTLGASDDQMKRIAEMAGQTAPP